MAKAMSELSSSLTTKNYKGWPCTCGHIRGLHKLTEASYFHEDEDDYGPGSSVCHCGCICYKAMDNFQYIEHVK